MKKLIVTLALTLIWMATANAADGVLMASAINNDQKGSTGVIITDRWAMKYDCAIQGKVNIVVLTPVEPGGAIKGISEIRIEQRTTGNKLWIKAWSTKNPSIPFTSAIDRLSTSYDLKEFRMVYKHIDGTTAFESEPFTGTEFNGKSQATYPTHCKTGYSASPSEWEYVSSFGKW